MIPNTIADGMKNINNNRPSGEASCPPEAKNGKISPAPTEILSGDSHVY